MGQFVKRKPIPFKNRANLSIPLGSGFPSFGSGTEVIPYLQKISVSTELKFGFSTPPKRGYM